MRFFCLVFILSITKGNGLVSPSVNTMKRHISRAFVLPQPSKNTVHKTKCQKQQQQLRRHRHHCIELSSTTGNEAGLLPTERLSSSEINLYNSLTNSKSPFTPLTPGSVSMYTCGPTVYDYAHVGNFRAFLTYDVLKRALRYFGLHVTHVCNLTDIDDKIITRCTKEGIETIGELTRRYEQFFMDDLKALNVVPADVYPRATEHIPEMVQMVQDLEKNGLAYQSEEGSWYFRVEKKEGYGKQLVDLDIGADSSGPQDADEYDADKVGLRDFALWKAYKPSFDREDAIWDTSIGRGRPGWHIECSAMCKKYFGDTIDIHCGGTDLKFPHHENEIAQSEGVSGEKFCSCWVHNGFVNIGEEKMSKSKGNFLTLRGACPTADDVRAYRYLIVSSQYRNPLSFTADAVAASKGALRRMDNVRKMLDDALTGSGDKDVEETNSDGNEIVATVKRELQNFEKALADDLSMPRAAASLFGVVKAAETEFKRIKKAEKAAADEGEGGVNSYPPIDLVGLRAVRDAMNRMDEVFGIFYEVPNAKDEDGEEIEDENDGGGEIPEEVMELVRSRMVAKDVKDWGLADSLRSQITDLGYAVKDVKDGEPIVTLL